MVLLEGGEGCILACAYPGHDDKKACCKKNIKKIARIPDQMA